MRSFQIGDRVVVKNYSPHWNDHAGVILSFKSGYQLVRFDSGEYGTGGFKSKYLELENNEADFVEDLV